MSILPDRMGKIIVEAEQREVRRVKEEVARGVVLDIVLREFGWSVEDRNPALFKERFGGDMDKSDVRIARLQVVPGQVDDGALIEEYVRSVSGVDSTATAMARVRRLDSLGKERFLTSLRENLSTTELAIPLVEVLNRQDTLPGIKIYESLSGRFVMWTFNEKILEEIRSNNLNIFNWLDERDSFLRDICASDELKHFIFALENSYNHVWKKNIRNAMTQQRPKTKKRHEKLESLTTERLFWFRNSEDSKRPFDLESLAEEYKKSSDPQIKSLKFSCPTLFDLLKHFPPLYSPNDDYNMFHHDRCGFIFLGCKPGYVVEIAMEIVGIDKLPVPDLFLDSSDGHRGIKKFFPQRSNARKLRKFREKIRKKYGENRAPDIEVIDRHTLSFSKK